MSYSNLPYEIFEEILTLLDGRSCLASACVCVRWNDMCEAFFNKSNAQAFWKNRCYEELPPRILEQCLLGSFAQDWLLVYKASCVQHSLSHRAVNYYTLELTDRFTKSPTWIYFIGKYMVVTRGLCLYIYDVTTLDLLLVRCLKFSVIQCLVKRKRVDSDGEETSQDTLVLLCGGQYVSHCIVLTASNILDDYELLPRSLGVTASFLADSSYFRCCCINNDGHFPLTSQLCLTVTFTDNNPSSVAVVECSNKQPQKSTCIDEVSDYETVKLHGCIGNDVIVEVLNDYMKYERLQIYSRSNHSLSSAIWLESTCLSTNTQGWDAQIFQNEESVTPMIALLSADDDATHVTIYSFE